MPPAVRLALLGFAATLALPLAGCKKSAQNTEALDNELAGAAGNEQGDAALTGALQDQIKVDRSPGGKRGARLSVDARGLLHVPPPTPAGAAPKGLTLGELAKSQAAPARGPARNCDKTFRYSMQWANRLPAALPLYPDAKVSEAAGNDAPECRVRVVSFASTAPLGTILDWYYTKAIRGGYTAEHQLSDGDHILGGTRESDGSAYYLIASAGKGGGTNVDLIANNGR